MTQSFLVACAFKKKKSFLSDVYIRCLKPDENKVREMFYNQMVASAIKDVVF